MRKLTDIEIQTIKDRLDRCLIAYAEIYDELLDHYITALERTTEEEFDRKKEALDDEFSWSIIKQMEKDLQKNAWKELMSASKSSYKIWTLGWEKVGVLILMAVILVPAFHFVGEEYFYLVALMFFVILMGSSVYFNRKKYGFTWSLAPGKHQPKHVMAAMFFGSQGLIFGIIHLSAQLLPKLLLNTPYEHLTPFIFLSLGIMILAYSWLVFTTINLKTFKLIKS
ncbi:hypothetical protein [Belliella aquatica]|uniref:Uncharacterized protein n=1 Tax=Belliella aquatica TaxID=1323734 RepID=A0ABQ1M2R4_9BACT|nr:hypothetical protein [Belliella aquatica]MCH7404882.1 hypothetical protein [Belliella aquatica]GGC33367.1 hypothetical protein GCM10010993_10350 [Belliella aquatica]